jgi:hypothetical protein
MTFSLIENDFPNNKGNTRKDIVPLHPKGGKKNSAMAREMKSGIYQDGYIKKSSQILPLLPPSRDLT